MIKKNLKKQIQIILNLYNSKNLVKAEILNKKLISVYPKLAYLYNLLGLILTGQQKFDEAINWYKKGLEIKADYAWIYNNLGSIYQSKGFFTKAENYFKRSIELDSKIAEPHNNLGNLNLFLNKHQQAIACFENALNINAEYFISHYNLGITYKSIGKFKEAKKHFKKTIEIKVDFYSAHRALSQITKYTEKDDHFIFLKKVYKDSKIRGEEKSEIAFALGKASEDVKDFKNAFKYFSDGNLFRRKNLVFSIKKEKEEFHKIKNIFNKNLFEKHTQFRNLDTKAIFIVGMPRSGTTLVEQILSSHSNVFGGDELNYLPYLIKKNFPNLYDIINVDDKMLNEISKEYVNSLNALSNNSSRVTDKLPINFKWIGFIKLLLPKSKIVHCIRNPKDNCLSIFKTYFATKKLNYAYDLDEISEFYHIYKDLMDYWRTLLPDFVFDIQYEKIINNPEKEIRNLLKECKLFWDNKCLKFYENKRPIKTASDTQARKKIYKSSINAWKNYEIYLKDFFKKI